MKVTPQIGVDLEDYPELNTLYNAAIRRVIDLMQIHNIATMHRIDKVGVFDHKYTKDIVTPIGVNHIPRTVTAIQYAVATALLDYLSTIGISGITLDVTTDEVAAITQLWHTSADVKNMTAEQGQTALTPEKIDDSKTESSTSNTTVPKTEDTQKKE